MSDEKYQGFSNYETWAVKMWIDNDPGTTDHINDLIDDQEIDDPGELADLIKEYIEENNPLIDDANLYADLLNAAIDNADYDEIAEIILND